MICHVAIPCTDLSASEAFYTQALGATLFRSYADRHTFGIANLQIVTHLCGDDQILWNPGVYPRHFGLTLADQASFEHLVERCRCAGAPIILDREVRFAGQPEQHLTFIVRDPAHNLIELKHYVNAAYAY